MDGMTGAGRGELLWLVVYSPGGERETELPKILPCAPFPKAPPSPGCYLNVPQEDRPQS